MLFLLTQWPVSVPGRSPDPIVPLFMSLRNHSLSLYIYSLAGVFYQGGLIISIDGTGFAMNSLGRFKFSRHLEDRSDGSTIGCRLATAIFGPDNPMKGERVVNRSNFFIITALLMVLSFVTIAMAQSGLI